MDFDPEKQKKLSITSWGQTTLPAPIGPEFASLVEHPAGAVFGSSQMGLSSSLKLK